MEIMAAAMPGISRSSLGRSFMQFAYHENQLRNSFFLFYQHALGSFRGFPWGGYVDAFWGFDSRGKLIDLHVRKGHDGL